MNFTADTRLDEIPNLKNYVDYLMYKYAIDGKPAGEMSVNEMTEVETGWHKESMLAGLDHFSKIAGKQELMLDVYAPKECEDDPEKEDVKLFYMPAESKTSDKPFVILIAGGGYIHSAIRKI